MEMGLMIIVGIILTGVILLVGLFKMMWRVAEPNEALIISGAFAKGSHVEDKGLADTLGFKIVTGKGTLVIPGFQTVRRLSLGLREAPLEVSCVTHQGIPLGIKGVIIFKVGDDYASIANAARRFLDEQAEMDARVHSIFSGHLRSIVGQLSVEDIIRDREKLNRQVRESSGIELQKLGLVVDSMQIQEVNDPTRYIENLGKPQAALIARDARIAEAGANKEATAREQEAIAEMAQARRDAEIKQAGFQAEIDRANAEAAQAGPLMEAQASKQVVVEQSEVAKLNAELKEQELQAEVRKPADARAYEQRILADADRDVKIAQATANAKEVELAAKANAERVRIEGAAEAEATTLKGRAEGSAIEARGLAEGAAIEARAKALAENQEAVIAQQLAEQWPAIVEAAGKPFASIDNMMLLDGGESLTKMMTQIMAQGAAGLSVAKELIGNQTKKDAVLPVQPKPRAKVEKPRVRKPEAEMPSVTQTSIDELNE